MTSTKRSPIRTAVLAVAAAALALAAWGCASESEEPVTLSLWHVYGSQTTSPLNDLVDEFNATVGAEKGIAVTVTSVTDSNSIDEELAAAAAGEPGSGSVPDLFTAYPRAAELVGAENLLNWGDYLTSDELNLYVDGFLAEGYFDEQLLMLPIAKSTETLFLDETLFSRFAADARASEDDLASFESLFALCERYALWSGGKSLFQIEDFYYYFLAAAAAYGGEFATASGLSCDGEWFEQAWVPLARAGITGGLCVGDGFASDRWQTGEILCSIGSTASVLYLRDTVSYADGTTEDISTAVLPYPVFEGAGKTVVQRGVGLFALKSADERKNQAAAEFARWITLQDANAAFATAAGYLPVTENGLADLGSYAQSATNEKYRLLYETIASSYTSYEFCVSPVFEGAAADQKRFEDTVQAVLEDAQGEYLTRTQAGEDAESVLSELVAESLTAMRTAW